MRLSSSECLPLVVVTVRTSGLLLVVNSPALLSLTSIGPSLPICTLCSNVPLFFFLSRARNCVVPRLPIARWSASTGLPTRRESDVCGRAWPVAPLRWYSRWYMASADHTSTGGACKCPREPLD